jgi:serine protease Do
MRTVWALTIVAVSAVAVLVVATGAAVRDGPPATAAPLPAPAADRTPAIPPVAADDFESPDVVAKRFGSEMERWITQKAATAPKLLLEQVQTDKSCTVQTLPDTGKKLDGESVYNAARRGTVIVGGFAAARGRRPSQVSFASGFVIQKDGIIVTNAHVVEAFAHMSGVGVMTHDRRVFPVRSVLAVDRHNDIAVLKIEADDLTPLPLARSALVGSTVYCLSHPALNSDGDENAFFTFTQGIVSGRFRIDLRGKGAINVLAITADYGQGSSGGPILNERGAVVGVVCETVSLSSDANSCDTQMTWKFARPTSSILAIIGGQPAAK